MGDEKMKFTVMLMGLALIVGSILMLISLPAYTPDEIRLMLIFVPVVTAIGLVLKINI